MNQWQNAQGQSDAIFPQSTPNHLNPSMYTNTNSPFDLNSTPTSFHPAQLHNGSGTSTPAAFANQTFQPGSVIPAKRPAPTSASPPPPAQVPRSQTPSYAGMVNQQPGQQYSAAGTPTPYSHLQQPGSNHATPSPTMQNQPYRQPSQQPHMQNASPSPFPGQRNNFANPMQSGTPQPGQIPNFNQQFGMNQGMSMPGLPASMAAQVGNLSNLNHINQQKQYQMRLLQSQQALQRNSGLVPPRSMPGQPNAMYNLAGQQPASQMPNGQSAGQMPNIMAQQQQQLMKKNAFVQQCAQYVMKQGRSFNPAPTVGGRLVDLYNLFMVVINMQGSAMVDRAGAWPHVATKLGFVHPQFPTAGEEIKQIYQSSVALYEKAWLTARGAQKHEQARQHAHQMALGMSSQASPTKPMPPPVQQSQYGQYPQSLQNQHHQQQQHQQQQSQTPAVQPNTSLLQNGMSTPQQTMNAPNTILHRRNSSMRKPEVMTPQAGVQAAPAPSPLQSQTVKRSPSVKQEQEATQPKAPLSTNYIPSRRPIDFDGGYDLTALFMLGTDISRAKPHMPSYDEMGIIDTKALTLSIASGIHSEVRYALDTLGTVTIDPRGYIELEKCEDLVDALVDCAEEQTDQLSNEAPEVSDALDLPTYEDILRGSRSEAESLQEVPEYGSQAWELDRAADRLIAVTTILRNFSFYEHNHRLLTSASLIKWLSNTIRLLGTRNMLLRTYLNTSDFYKDTIIFLSNVTQSLELPRRDDALHILHFLLAFAPQPSPTYTETGQKLRFNSFVPTAHRYLPPAVDCLAKLLARQDPNRVLYKSIFNTSSSSLAVSESPLDLLTRAFALSISVLPDRSKGAMTNSIQLRIVEARKAYLTQGMLAADILSTLLPTNDDGELARSWLESEDGWAASLLSSASLLSVEQPPRPPPNGQKGPPMQWDSESFKLITHRALTMLKRLAEKAGQNSTRHVVNGAAALGGKDGEDDDVASVPRWEGIPQGHAVIGALMLPNCDKTALGLLCGLHEMAMQQQQQES